MSFLLRCLGQAEEKASPPHDVRQEIAAVDNGSISSRLPGGRQPVKLPATPNLSPGSRNGCPNPDPLCAGGLDTWTRARLASTASRDASSAILLVLDIESLRRIGTGFGRLPVLHVQPSGHMQVLPANGDDMETEACRRLLIHNGEQCAGDCSTILSPAAMALSELMQLPSDFPSRPFDPQESYLSHLAKATNLDPKLGQTLAGPS